MTFALISFRVGFLSLEMELFKVWKLKVSWSEERYCESVSVRSSTYRSQCQGSENADMIYHSNLWFDASFKVH